MRYILESRTYIRLISNLGFNIFASLYLRNPYPQENFDGYRKEESYINILLVPERTPHTVYILTEIFRQLLSMSYHKGIEIFDKIIKNI